MAQRLLNKEIDDRVTIKLNKNIKRTNDGVNGLMEFGELNDYPQVMEKLINGSPTAKSTANVYASFLAGQGFENEELNDIVVGKDSRGKKITLESLLNQVAASASKNNGYYIHCNENLKRQITDVHLKPFKNMRFAKPDDTGYSAKLLYYDNWEKSRNEKYDKTKIKDFNVFNLEEKAFLNQVKEVKGIENFKGQIYFEFLDNDFFYPLSNYDEVYLDCDTESQISLYENRTVRDGFFDKTIMSVAPMDTEKEREALVTKAKDFLGPNGDSFMLVETDVKEDGTIDDEAAIKIDQIKSNVSPELFLNIKKGLSNNIRKAAKNMPNLLVEIEDGMFSGQSGEGIKSATNFFNSITTRPRTTISKSFKEIFSNSSNPTLANNTNWKIKPLNLIEQEKDGITDINTTTGN